MGEFISMVIRLLIINLIIIFQLVHSESQINSIDNQNTILVIGDSLSAAYGIELEESWVNLLRNQLKEYDTDTQWHVINASISGDTTTGGLERLPGLIKEHQPVLCIIALGANDGLRGQSLDIMQNNLDAMINMCMSTGNSLLVGIKLPPNYGDQYTQAFHNVYKNVAAKNNIYLVDFMLEGIAFQDEYFQADRLHPTAEAQPLILDNIWPQLEQLLN